MFETFCTEGNSVSAGAFPLLGSSAADRAMLGTRGRLWQEGETHVPRGDKMGRRGEIRSALGGQFPRGGREFGDALVGER